MKPAAFLIFLIFFSNCSDIPDEASVLSAMFTKKEGSIILKESVNLNEDPEPEFFYIGQNGQEEAVAIFAREQNKWLSVFQKRYSLVNRGTLVYDTGLNQWLPGSEKCSSCIIKFHEFKKIPGDNFFSVFMEILTEQPPTGLFSFPLVLRKGRIIFNGLPLFIDDPLLKSTKRISFSFTEKDGMLTILPDNKELRKEYIFQQDRFIKRENRNIRLP